MGQHVCLASVLTVTTGSPAIGGETPPSVTPTPGVSAVTKSLPGRAKAESALPDLVEHLRHLKAATEGGESALISRDTAKKAILAWVRIWVASNFELPHPAACTGPDGRVLYAWDEEKHHLELDIYPDGPAEFFYRNRETRELWEEDYHHGDPISDEAKARIALLV